MKDYKAIFEKVESTLISHSTLDADTIRERLEEFKHLEGRILSDNEYYRVLVHVVFYSGFKAATVNAKLEVIDGHFSDFERVAGYGNAEVERILSDPNMIRHKGKVQACIENARTFKSIVVKYGSFQEYVGSFEPNQSFENLMLLKEELQYRFKFLGSITTYHFLTDIGMPVIKPDRVVCRIFQRLGLIESIESEERLLKAVTQGKKFAQATGHPVRYIDIVFAVYGQMKSVKFGVERGICLKKNPDCSICSVRSYCNYHRE